MLKKSRVFLSCMALAGAGFGAAAGFGAEEARAAEMIRPEDEALLADIFAPAGSAEVSGGRAAVSGQEDGSGTEMKGARAASRVQAVPLRLYEARRQQRLTVLRRSRRITAQRRGMMAPRQRKTAAQRQRRIMRRQRRATR